MVFQKFNTCSLKTKDILALEKAENECLFLFKEGIFWRMYQYSAFRFVQAVRPLKPTKRFIKSVGSPLVSVGFPDGILEEVIESMAGRGWKVERSEKQIAIHLGTPSSEEAFQGWMDDISLQQMPAEKTGKSVTALSIEERVTQKIRGYPILEKSPLETQQFILDLQKEINGLT